MARSTCPGGTFAVSPGASPAAASLAVSGGSITGGVKAVATTIGRADLVAALDPGDRLVLSGNLSGPGWIEKMGPGTVVLSGSNSYLGGTIVEEGTLIVQSSFAIADGTNLTVGSAALADFAPVASADASAATAVPEPATWTLAAAGFAIVLLRTRRRALGG